MSKLMGERVGRMGEWGNNKTRTQRDVICELWTRRPSGGEHVGECRRNKGRRGSMVGRCMRTNGHHAATGLVPLMCGMV